MGAVWAVGGLDLISVPWGGDFSPPALGGNQQNQGAKADIQAQSLQGAKRGLKPKAPITAGSRLLPVWILTWVLLL